jgi:hypothetical protein
MDSERLEHVRRAGRRFGIGLFALLVSSFVVVCSAQILYQGFHDPNVTEKGNCRVIIANLASSVHAARQAANKILDERKAIEAFRAALENEWHARPSLPSLCSGDNSALDAIAAIDEWRWAEETAIRYESVDLAPTRRRAQWLASKLAESTEH